MATRSDGRDGATTASLYATSRQRATTQRGTRGVRRRERSARQGAAREEQAASMQRQQRPQRIR